jgi:hypothetical protein
MCPKVEQEHEQGENAATVAKEAGCQGRRAHGDAIAGGEEFRGNRSIPQGSQALSEIRKQQNRNTFESVRSV